MPNQATPWYAREPLPNSQRTGAGRYSHRSVRRISYGPFPYGSPNGRAKMFFAVQQTVEQRCSLLPNGR